MTKFQDAAREAAKEILANVPNWQYTAPELIEPMLRNSINRHYADLEATFGKLVELAKIDARRFQIYELVCLLDSDNPDPVDDDKRYEIEQVEKELPNLESRSMELLADPAIQGLLKEKV